MPNDTSIPMDEADQAEVTFDGSIDGAVEALLSRTQDEDGESLSNTDDTDETPEADLATEAEGDDTSEDTADEDAEADADPEDETTEETEDDDQLASDDAKVEFEVDGEKHRVSVADLKRLAGQEKALTRKSQEVAEARKNVEGRYTQAGAVLDTLLKKAVERAKVYEGIDLFEASRDMDPADFKAFREERDRAFQDVAFLQQEAGRNAEALKQARVDALREMVPQALEEIKKVIPEWDTKLYDDIRSYAVSQGVAKDEVNMIIDPAAISIINKARLYDASKKGVAEKIKSKAKPAPKKASKPSTRGAKADPSVKHMKQLETSGSVEDAAAAFLAARRG